MTEEKWLEPSEYDETEDCAICQEPLGQEQAIYQLRCGHKFHNNCLVNWCEAQKGSITCPLCRTDAGEGVCNGVWAFKEHGLGYMTTDKLSQNSPHTYAIYEKEPSGGKLIKKRKRKTTKKRKNNKKTRTRKNRRQMRK